MKKYILILILLLTFVLLFYYKKEGDMSLSKIREVVDLKKDTLLSTSFSHINNNIDKSKYKKLYTQENDNWLILGDIEFSVNLYGNKVLTGELPLDVFLEYVLPPIIDNENYETWKYECFSEFNFLTGIDSLKLICDTINKYLGKDFKFSSRGSDRGQSWRISRDNMKGNCYEMAKLVTYPLRALGYACAIDFVPGWGNADGSHVWNSIYHDGKMVPFMGLQNSIPFDPFNVYYHVADTTLGGYKYPPKVYRKTFSENKQFATMKKELYPNFNSYLLQDSNFKDVTSEYFEVSDVELLYDKEDKIVFLSVYNKHKWLPITAEYVKNSKVTFKNMNKDILYVLTNLKGDNLSTPFVLKEEKELLFFKPNKELTINIELFFLKPRIIEYVDAWGNLENLPNDIFNGIAEDYYRERPKQSEKYELYSFDCGEWKKESESIALDGKVKFIDIPSNALYILKSNSKIIGRCFTYENNQVIWR